VVQAEMDSILEYRHIQVKHGCQVGKDISFKDIQAKHDAVFIAVGLGQGRMLPLKNGDHADVHPGLEFLFDFNCATPWDLAGIKCLVIGGGDVAFDVARSALRCKAPVVNLCCLEREALGEMTGSMDEREGGRREGVIFNDGWGPDEIVVENGRVKGLKIKKVKRVFDENHRFAPEFLDETRFVEADKIFMAVGQKADLSFLDGSGVTINQRGLIEYDPETMATNVPGIYAGGDVALGPKLFIDAIASGSYAALGIDAYLTKTPLLKKRRKLTFTDADTYDRQVEYLLDDRQERDELDVDPATEPLVLGTIEYSESAAQSQAYRCLLCHIHPTFEGDICILCGGCVDVCPSYCLSMKTLDQLEENPDVTTLVEKEFGMTEVASDACSVMLFDPLKCVRCGMCAIKCPTGACKMSTNDFVDCYEPAK
jgi:thioredoxin reductase/ferredoxin